MNKRLKRDPALDFFFLMRCIREASCTVESDSVKLAGESEMWAIMVVLQLMLPSDSLSSMVSLLSLNNSSKIPSLDNKETKNPNTFPRKIIEGSTGIVCCCTCETECSEINHFTLNSIPLFLPGDTLGF